MEDQCSLLSWAFCHEEEGIEELRHSLLVTTLELQKTILSAQEEITIREDEVMHLKDLLSKTIEERDAAQAKCQKLMLEKLMLQQQQQQQFKIIALSAGTCSNEDDFKEGDSNTGFSTSDSEGNVIMSPATHPIPQPQLSPAKPPPPPTVRLVAEKPLPEKGKLLKAVMEAGPLLQTLLLAGPLPRWQHPPPQLHSIEIPPIVAPSRVPHLQVFQDSCGNANDCISKKRGLQVGSEGSCYSPNKYQRVVNH